MGLDELLLSLPKKWSISNICESDIHNGLTKGDKKEILKNADQQMQKGRIGKAASWLALAIRADQTMAFDYIKRTGMLHYTRQSPNHVCALAEMLSENSDGLGITHDNASFLLSVSNMYILGKMFREIESDILDRLKRRSKYAKKSTDQIRSSVVKELLVYVEYQFMKDDLEHTRYSKEELADALALVMQLYDRVMDLDEHEHGVIDAKNLVNGQIETMINLACLYRNLQGFEVLVSNFGYTFSAKGKFGTLRAPSDSLEKSIRLGFIRTNLQRYYLAHNVNQRSDSISFVEIAEQALEMRAIDFELVGDGPLRRYRLIMQPELLQSLFTIDKFFHEEILYLTEVFKERFLTIDDLNKIQIDDGLTLWDFVKLKRVFSFMNFAFSRKVMDNATSSDLETVFQSLLPVFHRDKLLEMLDGLAGKGKGDKFLKAVSRSDDSEMILDLQYNPFFRIGEHYYLAVNVFYCSDSIRNLYVSQRRQGMTQLLDNGENDPLSNLLSTAFEKQGFIVRTGIEFDYLGCNSDIDFLACKDETLYIMECKNPILPASVFELRNNYSYIAKANKQLNLSRKMLQSEEHRERLGRNLGIDLSQIVQLVKKCRQINH